MFDQIINFLNGLTGEDASEKTDEFGPDNIKLAAAALMFHVVRADGVMDDTEQQRLEELVASQNEGEAVPLQKLLDAAKKADAEAIDLYKFTSVLRTKLEMEERIHFIELLWELVYADGVRHELEDNVVWRISELMGVDSQARIAMRQRVQARMES